MTSSSENSATASDHPGPPASQTCPSPGITIWQELIDNLPYLAMLVLGAAIFLMGPGNPTWRGMSAAGYILYGVGGVLWIMVFMCPYCHFHGTRLCPCGYGRISAKLRPRQDPQQFARQFRRHIPVIVPLWFLPLIAGGVGLYRAFSWLLLFLLAVFAVNSFVLLPLLSRHYGCAKCPQKQDCPWMGGCRPGPDGAGGGPADGLSATAESNE